jgi:hypothetical protein
MQQSTRYPLLHIQILPHTAQDVTCGNAAFFALQLAERLISRYKIHNGMCTSLVWASLNHAHRFGWGRGHGYRVHRLIC